MLTEAQNRAVHTESKDVLVIAGAGSGKTRVITERQHHLIVDRGVPASSLLVLTFTRKAAAEMRGRLRERFRETHPDGDKAIAGLTMGTFHSIGLKILQAEGQHLGYQAPGIGVADPDDTQMLLQEVARDFGYHDGKSWKKGLSQKALDQALETYYTAGWNATHASGEHARIITEYHARLFSMNCVDFGRILTEVQRLFEHHQSVLERYRQAWKFVLVDEGQDLNTIQHVGFIRLLCPPAELFIVGDLRQAIYGFRGSRPDLLESMVLDGNL